MYWVDPFIILHCPPLYAVMLDRPLYNLDNTRLVSAVRTSSPEWLVSKHLILLLNLRLFAIQAQYPNQQAC
jgi:hypothetical protein